LISVVEKEGTYTWTEELREAAENIAKALMSVFKAVN